MTITDNTKWYKLHALSIYSMLLELIKPFSVHFLLVLQIISYTMENLFKLFTLQTAISTNISISIQVHFEARNSQCFQIYLFSKNN